MEQRYSWVLGKRNDEYHDVFSIANHIQIFDKLEIDLGIGEAGKNILESSSDTEIRELDNLSVSIQYEVSDNLSPKLKKAMVSYLPNMEDDLIYNRSKLA